MSLFKKLFGKNSPASEPPVLTPPPASPAPPDAPKMMKVWDAYGRAVQISREEWRTKVLPHNFRAAWNKPDDLLNLIGSALNDGFVADCLEPARQLAHIDLEPLRGATYLVVVLLGLKQFDEAEKIATAAMQHHGEDGSLLTNLAKAYSGKGDTALSERTLWHALEVDPNQSNGLPWYEAICRERDGKEAGLDALRRVAAIPSSWRAQLWLAREALQSRQLDQALELYRDALSRAGEPVPAGLLEQMSGDLGQTGHLVELLELTEPRFDVKLHGLGVGNNLIKAHSDLGQFDAARRLLNQLYAQKRPDWQQNLAWWDTELTKSRIAATASETNQKPKIAMFSILGPVWLKPDSLAAELFHANPKDAPKIAFIGSAAEIATNSKRIEVQMSNTPGRLSRSLPLFLAEQVEFRRQARVQTLIPWVVGDSPGFVLAGGPWTDEDAANYARDDSIKGDYVVTLLLRTTVEPWVAEVRLVQTIDAKCLAAFQGTFLADKPENGVPSLVQQLLAALSEHAELAPAPTSPAYEPPDGPWLAWYLLRLEQLLSVRCAGTDGTPNTFLSGEREIIGGNIQLCLDLPQNIVTRILLAQTLKAMKHARPDVVLEFKDKITLLQKQKTLPEPGHSVVQRMINEVLAE